MFTDDELKWLQRRLVPAAIDILFWSTGCALLFGNFSVISEWRDTRVWIPTALALTAAAVSELLTGATPGKLLRGWRVCQPDPARWSLGRLIVRGAVRLLPVALFLASLATSSPAAQLTMAAAGLTLASFYFPACYITLTRRRLTLFDLAAGTVTTHQSHSFSHSPLGDHVD